MEESRQLGYYWIKPKHDEWQVAMWDGDQFVLFCDVHKYINPEEAEKIDENQIKR